MDFEQTGEISWTVTEYEVNAQRFEDYIKNVDWSQIPAINETPLDSLTDGALIRYRGMVQDTLNPEFYGNYRVRDKKTGEVAVRRGKMRDLLDCADTEELLPDEENGLNTHDVRYPLFCIPIPGLNDWAKSSSTQEKPTSASSSQSSGKKRSFEGSIDDAMEDETKYLKIEDPVMPSAPNVPKYELDISRFFPLPERGGLACIIKHYGNDDDFLVNTRIEAVGFLSLNPALEAFWQDSDAEDRTMHPPPSLVPRLHAVFIRKLPHCHPSLPLNFVDGLNFTEIRCILEKVLKNLFFDDNLVANYVLCNLISTVYVRSNGLALGALSVNVYNMNEPNFPGLLYEFLKMIVPNNVYLPLTIDLLNTASFTPKKDYEANKLISGRLQLPDDTHVLVDETKMSSGTLQDQGCRNMAALHSLTLRQEIDYEFNYFHIPYHTNIPVLVLSEGKSMIPTDAPIKLPTNTIRDVKETFEAARFFLSGSRLSAVQTYLSALRLRQCDMSNIEFVGASWANLRQEHLYLKQDDLHRLLVISRLIALSYGRVILTKDDWDKAVAMEMERRSRSHSL